MKPPTINWCRAGNSKYPLPPIKLRIDAITKPPKKKETIILQLATPVHSNKPAPIRHIKTEVSPTEPGINPKKESSMEYFC